MEAHNITVVWHDNNEPVYSVNFQPSKDGNASERLATGGGDNNVRIWRITDDQTDGKPKIEYLSTLSRHTQAVNAVRFDPKGEMLATAGDDGAVLLWTLSDSIVKEFGQEPDEDLKESWILRHACKSSSSEIYDIAWSPDSKYIITGSTDNVSRIYDARTGQQVSQIAEHNHYVQGVAWDPLGKYIATQSADRSVHIYLLNYKDSFVIQPTVFYKIARTELPTRFQVLEPTNEVPSLENPTVSPSAPTSTTASIKTARSPSPLPAARVQNPTLLNYNVLKNSMLYHSENLESFFRRLTFSPDGSFLFTPSGVFKNMNTTDENSKDGLTNTVYIYTRQGLNKPPIAHLPGFKKPVIAISFSPVFYELDKAPTAEKCFDLPYKMVYAVATQDSVFVFDTQHQEALGSVSSIHYRILTDLTWNSDGNSLMVSSADGFCTSLKFKEGEFGSKLTVDHLSLLPQKEPVVKTSMESPARINKRQSTDVLDSVTTKKRVSGGIITVSNPASPSTRPDKIDAKVASKEMPKPATEPMKITDMLKQTVTNPSAKPKKRAVLITETNSESAV